MPGQSSERHAGYYTVYAQPNRSGFFGLTELHDLTTTIEPYVRDEILTTIILDFSLVRVWDIAALMWLGIGLHHYRHNAGLSYLLRLPRSHRDMSPKDRAAFFRSASYLRRWRFDIALSNIASDVDSLIVPEQSGYFSPDRIKVYSEKKVKDTYGLEHALISRRLVEIRNLTDPTPLGTRQITHNRINECVVRFQSERIGDILYAQCGIEKRKGDLFADHLLTEALMNVLEHPRATIGMVAISIMGKSKELVLAVADNGDSIPQTIYPRFYHDHNTLSMPSEQVAAPEYCRENFSPADRAEIADYATQEGITRKTGELAKDAGMGLTYIKRDTLDTLHGKLRLITDCLSLRYTSWSTAKPKRDDWHHSWRGNLLRIAIPVSKPSD